MQAARLPVRKLTNPRAGRLVESHDARRRRSRPVRTPLRRRYITYARVYMAIVARSRPFEKLIINAMRTYPKSSRDGNPPLPVDQSYTGTQCGPRMCGGGPRGWGGVSFGNPRFFCTWPGPGGRIGITNLPDVKSFVRG